MIARSQFRPLPDAPAGHPPVPPSRTGLLLLNLGTPDATDYWSMRRYLREFLWDRRVIEPPPPRWVWWLLLQCIILVLRPFRSGKAYRHIWNMERDESPLLTITREQTAGLVAELEKRGGSGILVEFAMRYGKPSIESQIRNLRVQGCDRLLCFALYPQFSAPTTATAYDQVFRALMRLRWQPAVRTVPAYFEYSEYINALVGSIRAHFSERGGPPEVLVASYHGLPKRYLEAGDPYHCHCMKTSRLVGERLQDRAPRIETTFQSRFGREEWLQPYTVERIAGLAREGVRDVAVLAPGFSADCLETLEEIESEIRDAFLKSGGKKFTYIPCLNAEPAHIRMLAGIVERELAGWL